MWLFEWLFKLVDRVIGGLARGGAARHERRQVQRDETLQRFRDVGRHGTQDRRPEIRIETIKHDRAQGFGQEAEFSVGKNREGYHYAVHVYPHEEHLPLTWHGPYRTQETAERRLNEARERWEQADAAREMSWEDRQIRALERQQQQAEREWHPSANPERQP